MLPKDQGVSIMRRSLWIAVSLLGLAAGAAAVVVSPGLVGRSEARTPIASEAVPRVVMVKLARVGAKKPEHRLPGIVAARTEADVGFRVGGKVVARTVAVGDRVRAGDVVARLDDADLRLELEAAEAARAAARIALDIAETNFDRVASLQSGGWASRQASDAETVAVEEARARLLQAERTAELAQNQLGYATLRADADGIVTQTLVEPGQVLTAGQPVVRLAHAGAREAVVAIPEAMVRGIEAARSRVELWSEPGVVRDATLRELSPVADAATRTFEARYALVGAADLELGMSVTVFLAVDGVEPAAAVPLSALLDSGSGPEVWVVGIDGRLEARPVRVGGVDGASARIVAGLADGDRVVVLGAHKLQAGEPVRAVAAEG
jgi:RND family efflux transporter MFP subunit